MSRLLTGMNPEQGHAVKNFKGPMLLLAGAGTGKTRVITHRIAYMVECGVAPSNIVALTFTNKAAREMRGRVEELVGEKTKEIFVGTFHSFCLSIIRSHPKKFGLRKGFGLLGTSDQIDVVRRCIEEKGWQSAMKAPDTLYAISSLKNKLIRPEEAQNKRLDLLVPGFDPAMLSAIYQMYQRALIVNNAIDFDDCISRVAWALADDELFRTKYKTRIQYLLVDEFQDTNLAQFELMKLLTPESHSVCAVGDDDQSIYSWRGAETSIMSWFENAFQGTKIVKLEQNYRCTDKILEAANFVIKNNASRQGKVLWSQKKSEDLVNIVNHDDEVCEAAWVTNKIMSLRGQNFNYSDIAILYRANAQARALETALRERHIPYKVFGGQSFFERKEVRDFLAYLRLSVFPEDRLAYWRVANTPSRRIGLKTMEAVEQIAGKAHCSPFSAVKNQSDTLGKSASAAMLAYNAALESLKSIPKSTPEQIGELARHIIKEFDLVSYIRKTSTTASSAQKKIDSLKRLPKWIESVAKEQFDVASDSSLEGILDAVTLEPARDKEEEKGHFVSLMTVHAAKGLEFPNVFIVGSEEGMFPHQMSLDEGNIEEERRLFYVAATRAKNNLTISYCRMRQSGRDKVERQMSRFLKELPDSAIQWEVENEEENKINLKGRQQSMLERLNSLKSFSDS